MNRYVLPTILMGLVAVGCGIHSRYNPNDSYGDIVSQNEKDLAANLEAAGSDVDAQSRAADQEAKFLAMGRDLFSDPGLGKNGQSCDSCHPGGGTTGGEVTIPKKMGHGPYVLPIPGLVSAAARFPKYKVPNGEVISLQHMNNNCIRMFMDGKRLPLDSPESIALATFVTSLSDGESIEVSGGQ